MVGNKAFDTHEYRDQYQALAKKFQQLYNQRMPVLQNYENFADTAVHDFLGQTSTAAQGLFAQSKQMGEAYTKDFLPATQEYLKSAQGYDTAQRRESEAGQAMTDVGTAGDAARQAAISRLEAYGIDPSQTRGAALDSNLRLETALGQAKAGREARTGVEERGRAYTRDALDLGQGLLSGQNALASNAGALGAAGVSAINQSRGTSADIYNQTTSTLLGGKRSAIDAAAQAKEFELQGKAASKGPSALSGIGNIAGTIAGVAAGNWLIPGGAGAQLGAGLGSQLGTQAGAAFQGNSAIQYPQIQRAGF